MAKGAGPFTRLSTIATPGKNYVFNIPIQPDTLDVSLTEGAVTLVKVDTVATLLKDILET